MTRFGLQKNDLGNACFHKHALRIEELKDRLAAAQSERDLLEAQVVEQRDYINRLELRERVRRESSPAGSTSSVFHRTTKLPDPPKSSGVASADELAFEDWTMRVLGKLEGNADHFPTEQFKIIYVAGRIVGRAATYIAPRLRPDAIAPYATAQDMVDHLRELYEDPNKVDSARSVFKRLIMRKSDNFYQFFPRFLHLADEAYEDRSKLLYELNDKISLDLRQAVRSKFHEFPKPSLTEFACYCTSIDNGLKDIANNRNAYSSRNPATTTTRTTTSTFELPDRTTTPSVPCETRTSTPAGFNAPRPLCSDPVKQRLRHLGACFHCGKVGHLSKYCPKKI